MDGRLKVDLMKATYETALQCGLPIVSTDTAARILAVVFVHGNNEFMVHCPKFNVEREYLQKRFRIKGGEIPAPEIIYPLKNYIRELEVFEKENPKEKYPEWARGLFRDRYGFDLINQKGLVVIPLLLQ